MAKSDVHSRLNALNFKLPDFSSVAKQSSFANRFNANLEELFALAEENKTIRKELHKKETARDIVQAERKARKNKKDEDSITSLTKQRDNLYVRSEKYLNNVLHELNDLPRLRLTIEKEILQLKEEVKKQELLKNTNNKVEAEIIQLNKELAALEKFLEEIKTAEKKKTELEVVSEIKSYVRDQVRANLDPVDVVTAEKQGFAYYASEKKKQTFDPNGNKVEVTYYHNGKELKAGYIETESSTETKIIIGDMIGPYKMSSAALKQRVSVDYSKFKMRGTDRRYSIHKYGADDILQHSSDQRRYKVRQLDYMNLLAKEAQSDSKERKMVFDDAIKTVANAFDSAGRFVSSQEKGAFALLVQTNNAIHVTNMGSMLTKLEDGPKARDTSLEKSHQHLRATQKAVNAAMNSARTARDRVTTARDAFSTLYRSADHSAAQLYDLDIAIHEAKTLYDAALKVKQSAQNEYDRQKMLLPDNDPELVALDYKIKQADIEFKETEQALSDLSNIIKRLDSSLSAEDKTHIGFALGFDSKDFFDQKLIDVFAKIIDDKFYLYKDALDDILLNPSDRFSIKNRVFQAIAVDPEKTLDLLKKIHDSVVDEDFRDQATAITYFFNAFPEAYTRLFSHNDTTIDKVAAVLNKSDYKTTAYSVIKHNSETRKVAAAILGEEGNEENAAIVLAKHCSAIAGHTQSMLLILSNSEEARNVFFDNSREELIQFIADNQTLYEKFLENKTELTTSSTSSQSPEDRKKYITSLYTRNKNNFSKVLHAFFKSSESSVSTKLLLEKMNIFSRGEIATAAFTGVSSKNVVTLVRNASPENFSTALQESLEGSGANAFDKISKDTLTLMLSASLKSADDNNIKFGAISEINDNARRACLESIINSATVDEQNLIRSTILSPECILAKQAMDAISKVILQGSPEFRELQNILEEDYRLKKVKTPFELLSIDAKSILTALQSEPERTLTILNKVYADLLNPDNPLTDVLVDLVNQHESARNAISKLLNPPHTQGPLTIDQIAKVRENNSEEAKKAIEAAIAIANPHFIAQAIDAHPAAKKLKEDRDFIKKLQQKTSTASTVTHLNGEVEALKEEVIFVSPRVKLAMKLNTKPPHEVSDEEYRDIAENDLEILTEILFHSDLKNNNGKFIGDLAKLIPSPPVTGYLQSSREKYAMRLLNDPGQCKEALKSAIQANPQKTRVQLMNMIASLKTEDQFKIMRHCVQEKIDKNELSPFDSNDNDFLKKVLKSEKEKEEKNRQIEALKRCVLDRDGKLSSGDNGKTIQIDYQDGRSKVTFDIKDASQYVDQILDEYERELRVLEANHVRALDDAETAFKDEYSDSRRISSALALAEKSKEQAEKKEKDIQKILIEFTHPPLDQMTKKAEPQELKKATQAEIDARNNVVRLESEAKRLRELLPSTINVPAEVQLSRDRARERLISNDQAVIDARLIGNTNNSSREIAQIRIFDNDPGVKAELLKVLIEKYQGNTNHFMTDVNLIISSSGTDITRSPEQVLNAIKQVAFDSTHKDSNAAIKLLQTIHTDPRVDKAKNAVLDKQPECAEAWKKEIDNHPSIAAKNDEISNAKAGHAKAELALAEAKKVGAIDLEPLKKMSKSFEEKASKASELAEFLDSKLASLKQIKENRSSSASATNSTGFGLASRV